MTAVAVPLSTDRPPVAATWGRAFVHPAFDVLVIGGGLSLLVTALLVSRIGPAFGGWAGPALPYVFLLTNATHFAASTVRLYTKPGAFRDLRFLTMGLPLVTIVALFVAIALAQHVGRHLWGLYLSWSPYHYAAQTYGLALMYCFRSGCRLGLWERRFLRFACLTPFFLAFTTTRLAGVEWLVPASVLALPAAVAAREVLGRVLALLTLALVTNGIWWVVLRDLDAFVWATIFHGLQYLAIVTIYHAREHAEATAARGWLVETLRFYALCLGLGYLLFYVWPMASVLAGFGLAEGAMMVVVAVNIHHFVVDAYIWRLRRDPAVAAVAALPGAV